MTCDTIVLAPGNEGVFDKMSRLNPYNLSPDEVAKWVETLYINIPEIQLVNAMRDELRRNRVDGAHFDEILHANKLPTVLRYVWPNMSPRTAVLVRKTATNQCSVKSGEA